jgi:hypothetical protein
MLSLQAVHQLYRAVVFYLKPLGQHPDTWLLARSQAADGQERLVLVWLDTDMSCGLLAEIQESSNFITEIR